MGVSGPHSAGSESPAYQDSGISRQDAASPARVTRVAFGQLGVPRHGTLAAYRTEPPPRLPRAALVVRQWLWRFGPIRIPIPIARVAYILAMMVIASVGGCSAAPTELTSVTPPDGKTLLSGAEINSLIEADFVAYDPDYPAQRAQFGERLRMLAASLANIQATGKTMACSTQIYLEAEWLYEYTADWERLNLQLARLAESVKDLKQSFARLQAPGTGAWGVCYDEWFLQVEATLAALEDYYQRNLLPSPPHPLQIPSEIGTPEKMIAYLNRLLVSDVATAGRDNRGELGNITTILSLAFFKDYLRDYVRRAIGRRHDDPNEQYLQPQDQAIYLDFLHEWQDPQTGYWGAWYRSKGRIYKTADLSITYHTIAYRRGQVAYWPQIIDTTLRIKTEPYPYGWLHDGHFNNHNNYDVARILKYGWSHMSAAQKRQASDAIREMLAWTLAQSLNPDGSFKTDPTFFSSVAADYYFGVSFLDEIGFWDRSKRFWTHEVLPGAESVCRRLKARMAMLKFEDLQARVAREKLNAAC